MKNESWVFIKGIQYKLIKRTGAWKEMENAELKIKITYPNGTGENELTTGKKLRPDRFNFSIAWKNGSPYIQRWDIGRQRDHIYVSSDTSLFGLMNYKDLKAQQGPEFEYSLIGRTWEHLQRGRMQDYVTRQNSIARRWVLVMATARSEKTVYGKKVMVFIELERGVWGLGFVRFIDHIGVVVKEMENSDFRPVEGLGYRPHKTVFWQKALRTTLELRHEPLE